jgi:hypothetical protein
MTKRASETYLGLAIVKKYIAVTTVGTTTTTMKAQGVRRRLGVVSTSEPVGEI